MSRAKEITDAHIFELKKNKLIARPKELHHHIQANQTTVFFFSGFFFFSFFPPRSRLVRRLSWLPPVCPPLLLYTNIDIVTCGSCPHDGHFTLEIPPSVSDGTQKFRCDICAPAPFWYYYHLFVCFVIIVWGYNNRRRLILDSSRAHPTSTVGFSPPPPNDLK